VIILDTNVVSELMKAQPDPVVTEWVRGQSGSDSHTTAVTLAEVFYGIARLPAGVRRDSLHLAGAEIFATFAHLVLAFDSIAGFECSKIVSERESLGAPINGFDAQIAAICSVNQATLVTRNIKDFHDTGINLINPWVSISPPEKS
jgi:hypothetical protein